MATLHSILLRSCLFAALLGSEVFGEEQRSRQESLKRYPEYHGEVPLGDRITTAKKKIGDLTGNISADRELNAHDLDYILKLSDFLVDKRNDPGTRASAAATLEHFGHQLAIPALLAVLRDEKDSKEVRREAITALSMIRDKRVVSYLIEDGLGSDDVQVASQASDDLAQLVGGPLAQIPGLAKGVPKDLYDPDLEPPNYNDYGEERKDEYNKRYREYLHNVYQHRQNIWRTWWKKNRANIKTESLNRAERWAY